MSICNMAIEAGARAGLIQPDEVTFEYLKGRPMVPGADDPDWDAACEYWTSLQTDEGAHYDIEVHIDAADIAPTVTWGTSPQDTAPITGTVPDPMAEEVNHHFILKSHHFHSNILSQSSFHLKHHRFIGSCASRGDRARAEVHGPHRPCR